MDDKISTTGAVLLGLGFLFFSAPHTVAPIMAVIATVTVAGALFLWAQIFVTESRVWPWVWRAAVFVLALTAVGMIMK